MEKKGKRAKTSRGSTVRRVTSIKHTVRPSTTVRLAVGLEEQNVAAALDSLRKCASTANDAERVLHAYILKLETEVGELRETSERRIAELENEMAEQLEAAADELDEVRSQAERDLLVLQKEHTTALTKAQGALEKAQRRHEAELAAVEEQHESSLSQVRGEYEARLRTSSDELEALRDRIRELESRLGSARDIIVEPFRSRTA